MKIILTFIEVSVLFSIGFVVGAWWNYVHTINKQIERFEVIKGGKKND